MPSPAQQLVQRLDHLNHIPTWDQAARLGVELVHIDDTHPDRFYLADGALVSRQPGGWSVLLRTSNGVRPGGGSSGSGAAPSSTHSIAGLVASSSCMARVSRPMSK